jgi:hypothetical protein
MGLKLAHTIRTTLGQDVVDSIDIGQSFAASSPAALLPWADKPF